MALNLYGQRLRVVGPHRIPDPYNPKNGTITLDPNKGAHVSDARFEVSCQPLVEAEETEAGTRIAVASTWRIITRPGSPIPEIGAADGVLINGIDGVLKVQGEVGGWPFPPLAHIEFIATRWKG